MAGITLGGLEEKMMLPDVGIVAMRVLDSIVPLCHSKYNDTSLLKTVDPGARAPIARLGHSVGDFGPSFQVSASPATVRHSRDIMSAGSIDAVISAPDSRHLVSHWIF